MTATTPLPTRPGTTAPTSTDVPALARTLAAAFHDDPVLAWFAPDPAARRALLPPWFAAVAAALLPHGLSRCTPALDAVALWVPPATEPVAEADSARLTEATEAFGAEAAARSAAISQAMEAAHPAEPHHYLWFLGVAPERQGAGLGSTILADHLADLDRRGEAAYLEATSTRNRRLYARHGFEVVQVVRAADSPPLWAMWRAPR